LLIRRSPAEARRDRLYWEFPGGVAHKDETDPGREVLEETGIVLPEGLTLIYQRIRKMEDSIYSGSKYQLAVWLARIDQAGVRLSDEHDGHLWLPPSRTPPRRIKPEVLEVLPLLRA